MPRPAITADLDGLVADCFPIFQPPGSAAGTGAAARGIAGGDAAAVLFDDALDHEQAEAEAGALHRLRRAVVALEDALDLLRPDADAVIARR